MLRVAALDFVEHFGQLLAECAVAFRAAELPALDEPPERQSAVLTFRPAFDLGLCILEHARSGKPVLQELLDAEGISSEVPLERLEMCCADITQMALFGFSIFALGHDDRSRPFMAVITNQGTHLFPWPAQRRPGSVVFSTLG